ncbi:MAG: FecR family protein [Williamsia sp.]|nr:FecR family protein [Williamsia sp.]
MEAQDNMDELLTRYLFNESEPDERLVVTNWINKSEENYQYFEGLKKTVELLTEHNSISKINVEEEWNYLQRALAAGASHPLRSGDEHAAPAGTNRLETHHPARRKLYRLIIPVAVAASVIVFVLMHYINPNSRVLPGSPVESVAADKPDNAVMHHEINTSGSTKSFSLPDGSRIMLSDRSELTYIEAAGNPQRTVSLRGEADFSVAKDKTRPFIVNSGAVSTTAVGTRFTVTAFEDDPSIQVKLTEGKVLVKAEKAAGDQQKEDFYLVPGQRLIYDKNRKTVRIKSFRKEKGMKENPGSREKTLNDNPLLPEYNKKSWFMFNNQSLDEIFHALEFMYDVKIAYTKKDVEQRYFVGTFSKSDSVESILNQIAGLNKLTVTRKDNTYTIEKKK